MKKKEIIIYIVDWLNKYCDDTGMKGFAIGISGGIDSALTSTLCAKTGKPVLCLNMSIHQHEAEHTCAKNHILWLKENFPNVTSFEIDLTKAFQKIEQTIPGDIQDWHTMANTRSRLRMLTLYAFSGNKKLLVAGTGNKVEDFGIGFFTKYGDGGVDISPIAELMKSEVYALAKELDIIDLILKAPPTDGLWPDRRSDEDQIGASYDELEWAMNFSAKPTDFSLLTLRQKKVLEIFNKFHQANHHKMIPIPICIIPKEFKI